MHRQHDGMLVVKAELRDRLETLQEAGRRIELRDLVQGLTSIRTMAAAYGMTPVVCLAEAFERAIRTQPRGCPAGLYFNCLRDAIGCERSDATAGESYLASVSVRLGA